MKRTPASLSTGPGAAEALVHGAHLLESEDPRYPVQSIGVKAAASGLFRMHLASNSPALAKRLRDDYAHRYLQANGGDVMLRNRHANPFDDATYSFHSLNGTYSFRTAAQSHNGHPSKAEEVKLGVSELIEVLDDPGLDEILSVTIACLGKKGVNAAISLGLDCTRDISAFSEANPNATLQKHQGLHIAQVPLEHGTLQVTQARLYNPLSNNS